MEPADSAEQLADPTRSPPLSAIDALEQLPEELAGETCMRGAEDHKEIAHDGPLPFFLQFLSRGVSQGPEG